MTAGTLTPRLQEIAGDFGAVPGNERLQLLLEFSEQLPPLPARYAGHRDLLERVPECQTPLFVAIEVDGAARCTVLRRPAGVPDHPRLRRHPPRRPRRSYRR